MHVYVIIYVHAHTTLYFYTRGQWGRSVCAPYRKYYKLLHQERATARDTDLEKALKSQPLKPNDAAKLEGAITMEELQATISS